MRRPSSRGDHLTVRAIEPADSSASRSATRRCSSGPVCWKSASPRSRPRLHWSSCGTRAPRPAFPPRAVRGCAVCLGVVDDGGEARVEADVAGGAAGGLVDDLHSWVPEPTECSRRRAAPRSAVVFGGMTASTRRTPPLRDHAGSRAAVRRQVLGGRGVEPGERMRRDADPRVARRIRREPGDDAVQPVADRAEGVVVERRHLAGVDRAVGQHRVPALPDRRRAHRDRVQPRRVLGLHQQASRGLEVAGAGEGVLDDRRADEPRADAIARPPRQLREPVAEHRVLRRRARCRRRSPSRRRSARPTPCARTA